MNKGKITTKTAVKIRVKEIVVLTSAMVSIGAISAVIFTFLSIR